MKQNDKFDMLIGERLIILFHYYFFPKKDILINKIEDELIAY